MRHLKSSLLALAASLAVVACGGGSSADTTPRTAITSVKVFGDSLADSGTFSAALGFSKFTVQDGQVYPERVAASYGITALCNFYVFTGTTFAANSKAGCTNFAIGGGVINGASSGLSAADPRGIQVQLATAGTLGFSATDLAVIDGGGNDAAALLTAFSQAQAGSATPLYTLLTSLLPASDVATALAGGASTTAAIGGAYMKALADAFANSVTTNVLGKGATHVVILNLPAVTKTPQFQKILGAMTPTAAAQAEGLFQQWFAAYNAELAAKFASEDRVVVVDFYNAFLDQVANPAQYGITTEGAQGVFTELCPAADSTDPATAYAGWRACTAANLSAASGHSSPDWWKNYAFANQFHPTPYGHQLVAQLISKSLSIKGWL
ncbi:SGNH/GDSL hydrolase family protein [Paucibacter sp. R3-3]|uniref:SGNH/GDSL hydrolase family protein n=1 Tax=Roseateles agri TaxID=3098619 RepID=A0ABU5DEN4_9BURK|nr:SGNH/GDSL hydrolase family protein [Paucibacter sp. R3-3]MDY0744731.1 SGNH/GDSL hydrolase family protein [Paucibacter sp. R3-3]